jgi:hypothetical protein
VQGASSSEGADVSVTGAALSIAASGGASGVVAVGASGTEESLISLSAGSGLEGEVRVSGGAVKVDAEASVDVSSASVVVNVVNTAISVSAEASLTSSSFLLDSTSNISVSGDIFEVSTGSEFSAVGEDIQINGTQMNLDSGTGGVAVDSLGPLEMQGIARNIDSEKAPAADVSIRADAAGQGRHVSILAGNLNATEDGVVSIAAAGRITASINIASHSGVSGDGQITMDSDKMSTKVGLLDMDVNGNVAISADNVIDVKGTTVEISAGSSSITDQEGIDRFAIGTNGDVSLLTAAGEDLNLNSGGSIVTEVGRGGELTFSHADATTSDKTIWRMRSDLLVSHVPLQTVQTINPSDKRIKRDIFDVDEDAIYHRFQNLEIKKYRYTDEWRRVRGIDDREVRGVIAQQVAKIFPEYVNIEKTYEAGGSEGVKLDDFHQVDKIRIAVDLVAALHAQHKRFTIGENSAVESGNVIMSSADAGSYDINADGVLDGTNSGGVSLRTGSSAIGSAGDITLSTGAGSLSSGDFTVELGDTAVGGDPATVLTSGGGAQFSTGGILRAPGLDISTASTSSNGGILLLNGRWCSPATIKAAEVFAASLAAAKLAAAKDCVTGGNVDDRMPMDSPTVELASSTHGVLQQQQSRHWWSQHSYFRSIPLDSDPDSDFEDGSKMVILRGTLCLHLSPPFLPSAFVPAFIFRSFLPSLAFFPSVVRLFHHYQYHHHYHCHYHYRCHCHHHCTRPPPFFYLPNQPIATVETSRIAAADPSPASCSTAGTTVGTPAAA